MRVEDPPLLDQLLFLPSKSFEVCRRTSLSSKMTSVVTIPAATLDNLKDEYSRVQEGLRAVESKIRKLPVGETAKRPKPTISSIVHRTSSQTRLSSDSSSKKRRGSEDPDDESEESEDEEADRSSRKRSLLSTVVTTTNTRKPPVAKLRRLDSPEDPTTANRNRRMFGIMLGTLAKFQSEEYQRKDLTLKRVNIEKKLEGKQEKEAEELNHQHQQLLRDKKLKQAEMKKVESKMIRMQGFDVWEKNASLLSSHFIQTKSKPCIFFVPKIMTPEMEKKQKATRDKYRVIIAEKRAKVQKDFNEIDQVYEKEVEELREEDVVVDEVKDIDDSKAYDEAPAQVGDLEVKDEGLKIKEGSDDTESASFKEDE